MLFSFLREDQGLDFSVELRAVPATTENTAQHILLVQSSKHQCTRNLCGIVYKIQLFRRKIGIGGRVSTCSDRDNKHLVSASVPVEPISAYRRHEENKKRRVVVW